jgi:NinB protein
MSRALLILGRPDVMERAINWIRKAPPGTRVEFKAPRRTLEQNARMWAMLTDFAAQVDHHGRKYSPEEWKAIFMHALGKEMKFVPALDGQGFVPIGQKTSELSVPEMCDLQELMAAEGAKRGVKFHAEILGPHKEAA